MRLIFLPLSSSSFTDLDQAVAVGAGATTLVVRCWAIGAVRWKRWQDRKYRRSLLQDDDGLGQGSAYTDEATTTSERPWNDSQRDDIELGAIAPNEASASTENPPFVMSGALAADSDGESEPDDPLPTANT